MCIKEFIWGFAQKFLKIKIFFPLKSPVLLHRLLLYHLFQKDKERFQKRWFQKKMLSIIKIRIFWKHKPQTMYPHSSLSLEQPFKFQKKVITCENCHKKTWQIGLSRSWIRKCSFCSTNYWEALFSIISHKLLLITSYSSGGLTSCNFTKVYRFHMFKDFGRQILGNTYG